MENFETNFREVFARLRQIDFLGESGPPFPFEVPPIQAAVAAAIQQGANRIPYLFRTSYSDPLLRSLSALMQDGQEHRSLLETLTGAVYQHAQPELIGPLRRLLAVTSDLFRSFLSNKRRTAADVRLVEAIPPLAIFQRDGGAGPFTYTCSDVQRYTGASVGVVSLPASYRDHPLLWTTLAHETGGHDVIHADPLLLPELERGAKTLFGGGPQRDTDKLSSDEAFALLWSYWMEEAAADVYAIMNVGPSFGLNLAVYFSALNAQIDKSNEPVLHSSTGFSATDPTHALDTHPGDLLRLSLISGAVESLRSLSSATKARWTSKFDALAGICGQKATEIHVTGVIADGPGRHIPVELTIPMPVMQEAARKVGAFVATSKLNALSGKSIQDIETWDNDDESTANRIAARFASEQSAAGAGDDAQILAGANLALFESPSDYEKITRAVEEALDVSFLQDPYWAKLSPNRIGSSSAQLSLKGSGLTPLTLIGGG